MRVFLQWQDHPHGVVEDEKSSVAKEIEKF